MIKDGKNRYTLQFGMNTAEERQAGQFLEQLGRKPYPYPTIEIRKADSLFDYQYEDFKVVGYQHHPTIKAPVAV